MYLIHNDSTLHTYALRQPLHRSDNKIRFKLGNFNSILHLLIF